MKKTTIFICAHKVAPLPLNLFFLPILEGTALHEHIANYQPDDEVERHVPLIMPPDTNQGNLSISNSHWSMRCLVNDINYLLHKF